MSAAPCKECGRRPKLAGRHRCEVCQLRHEPIGDQVIAARRRLAMVPETMRVKRSKAILAQAPAGTSWCAGCQSFRDLEDFASKATKCRACASAKSHEAMISKTYGLAGDDYTGLLERQGGRCAICRARPRSKRLAVDHNHATGAVRGLLCSRCNHDLMGAAWDSLAIASALWHYMNTPPAEGAWMPPEKQAELAPVGSAQRPAERGAPLPGIVTREAGRRTGAPSVATATGECGRPHVLPVGSQPVSDKRGVWRVWVDDDPAGDAPF